MKLEDAKPGMRVRYVPGHARGDVAHPDCEVGVVTSVGRENVFVKFDPSKYYGIACDPQSLVAVP